MLDHEERGLKRRREVLEMILRRADAGEILSIPELHRRLPWGADITKHGLIHVVATLEEQGLLERRWGPEFSTEKKGGRKSFVLPTPKAFAARA